MKPHDSVPPKIAALVYEDEHLFVAFKPHGLHSVKIAEGGASLADWLLELYPSLASVAERPGDAGLVQRLDFDTSGIIVGGKNKKVWAVLREIIQLGKVDKRYIALLSGVISKTTDISSFLGSPNRGAKKVRVYLEEPRDNARALYGETTFSPLETNSLGHTLVEVFASPARRHQIRAHAGHIGAPLVGDTLYGAQEHFSTLYGTDRQFFLHCERLSFTHPITNDLLVCNAPFEAPQPLR